MLRLVDTINDIRKKNCNSDEDKLRHYERRATVHSRFSDPYQVWERIEQTTKGLIVDGVGRLRLVLNGEAQHLTC
jgi:hypothetical protein